MEIKKAKKGAKFVRGIPKNKVCQKGFLTLTWDPKEGRIINEK